MILEYSSPNKKAESFAVLSKSKGRPNHRVFLLSLSWIPQLAWAVPADAAFLDDNTVALSSPVKVRSCIKFSMHLTHICHTELGDDTCAASATLTRVIMFLLGTDVADSGPFGMTSVDSKHYVVPVRCEHVWWVGNVNVCNGNSFNLLQPSGLYMYRTVVTICTTSLTFTVLRSAHTVYLCVLCGSENKQRLFPYTALTDWFL